jgi:hypothetical protein
LHRKNIWQAYATSGYLKPDPLFSFINVCKDFDLASVEEGIEFVRSRVDRKDIILVPGFFSDTLTEDYGKELANSGSYIHIDVDIHASTYQVLDFLFKYNIPRQFSLIRYDDWCSTPEFQGGNSLAHIEIARKYNVPFHRISTNVFQLM